MPKPERYLGRLTGKVAIVTGAGCAGEGFGTGRAISIVMAGEGARVCLVDMDRERAEATLAMIEAAGGEAFVTTADVTVEDECRRVVAETADRYGGVDILVNNVGVANIGDLETFDEARWTRDFEINLKSVILMSRQAVPLMAARKGGAIINISSIGGIRRYGGLAYGPSKAAMIALSGEIAVMTGPQGIRSNVIAPGHINTPLTDALLGDEFRAMRRKAGPLAIEGDAWDVASAALFLASDEARFITAACLTVDGGVSEMGSLKAHGMILDPAR
jgi:NAD(P)-dependent dehydrogenase (short-subunit alcohol dehydrogenase family)